MFILKNTLLKKKLSKSKQEIYKIVILTSLFWILIDSFVLIFYLNETNTSGSNNEKNFRYLIKKSVSVVGNTSLDRSITTSTTAKSIPKINLDDKLKQLRVFKLKDIELIEKIKPALPITRMVKWFKDDGLDVPTNPTDWPGENGIKVELANDLKALAEKKFSENQFNIIVSDKIALNRTIPDQRPESYNY